MACLKKQREFFCTCVANILQWGLRSLNELDTIEEAERITVEKEGATLVLFTLALIDLFSLNPALVLLLFDFNPFDPY